MEINWFTLIAQIINFALLVWLLKRFLYGPILEAIAEREAKIVSQLNEAEAKKAEALKEQEEFKQKNLDFEEAKKELMNRAISESKETKLNLLEEARTEAEALRSHLDKTNKEKRSIQEAAITHKIQEEVFAISKKALSDLATASLEEQAIVVFIHRLKSLKDDDLDQFKKAFKNSKIIVRSAFPLSEIHQNQIKEQLHKLLERTISVEVELAPELIAGIELGTRDYRLSWSVSGYLRELEEKVFEKK